MKARHRSQHPRSVRQYIWIIVCLIIIGAYAYFALLRPLPELQPTLTPQPADPASTASTLPWPATGGQGAVGINNAGVLATYGAQTPIPTASTAKLITALSVLNKDPLQVGEQGPTITMSQADVNIYNTYVAEDGSVVPVVAGEQISEYQMLECMLLPSANNMADSLATWAFGSLSDYATYANNYTKQLGLTNTHVGVDASGFDPSTTSTASDLVLLGEAAMQNPVIAQIVGEKTASGIPVAGTIRNVDSLIGTDGIIGIKTGNNDQDMGVFVSASKTEIGGQTATIITALAGASSLSQALESTVPLVQAAQNNFVAQPVATAGNVVGTYKLPWGGSVEAVAEQNLTAEAWKGSPASAAIHLSPISMKTSTNQVVGKVTVKKSLLANAQTADVVLKQAPKKPSIWWRLVHPTA